MPDETAGAGSLTAVAAGSGGVLLEGLDGGTPLGFLAGLGAQRVLADRAAASDEPPPRLSWRSLDAWRPVLHGPPSVESVVDAVYDDAVAWRDAPILRFRYLKLEKNGPKPVAALKAPVAVLRAWLVDRRNAGDDVSLAYACALMCETATDVVKEPATREQLAQHGIDAAAGAPLDRSTLPTFFDFSSRNAQFLEQVEAIRAHLSPSTIEAGLRRGSPDPEAPRSMDWDPGADTPGAIYTGYSRGFLPVAEWLAFRGLVRLPVTGVGRRLATTACTGRRKGGTFAWPLWEGPAGPDTVGALVAYPDLDGLDAAARGALGIAAVWRADLTKKADGYSGMFSPAQTGLRGVRYRTERSSARPRSRAGQPSSSPKPSNLRSRCQTYTTDFSASVSKAPHALASPLPSRRCRPRRTPASRSKPRRVPGTRRTCSVVAELWRSRARIGGRRAPVGGAAGLGGRPAPAVHACSSAGTPGREPGSRCDTTRRRCSGR